MSLEDTISFLKAHNEINQAIQLLNTFSKYATRMEEFDNLGKCYNDIKHYQEAIKWAEKALVIAPNNDALYACRSNLAKLHNCINDPEKALFYININEKITPNDYDILLEKAFCLFLLNRKKESLSILESILKQENIPDNVRDRVVYNMATHDMYKGDYKRGLRRFTEVGTTLKMWQSTKLPLQKWDGIIRLGRTIVIYAPGGIGDEFINVRFCEDFTNLGMNPLWYTDRKELVPIFARSGVNCITSLKGLPSDAVWVHGMAVPTLLDLEPYQLMRKPYITPNPEYIKKWENIINSNKIKVGLRWAGNAEYDHDLHRQLPIIDLYKQIKNENCDYFSLQRDSGAELVSDLDGVLDLQNELKTFEDTLAVLSLLDVFITSCTSVAHASAAMGKRTIVLVPIAAYYVWIGGHWYGDNVTVIFQETPRSWQQSINELQQYLNKIILT